MSQGTAEAVLEVARRNIGFVEGPKNKNPYAPFAGHADNQPWCASFVCAVFKRAQVPLRTPSAWTPALMTGFAAEERLNTVPRVGDVFFLYFASLGRVAHCGIVEALLPDGRVQTIEGNTDAAGGRTGGRVMRKNRSTKDMSFGHPSYKVAAPITPTPSPTLKLGSKGPKVTDVQNALFKRRYLPEPKKATVDGAFGPLTAQAVRTLQMEHGRPQTGVVSSEEWAILRRIAHGS